MLIILPLYKKVLKKRKMEQTLEKFNEHYIPEVILFREKEIYELKHLYEVFRKWGSASNLFIRGSTGSGKTCIVKKVMEEEGDYLYMVCSKEKTIIKSFNQITSKKCPTYSSVIHDLIEQLKNKRKVLIIDEVDKLDSSNITNLCDMVNAIHREVDSPVIFITTKNKIYNTFPADFKSTLMFRDLRFPSYNAVEIQEIIKNRLEESKLNIPELTTAKIALISLIACNDGSARSAMKILYNCIKNNNFEEEFIKSAYNKVEQDSLKEYFESEMNLPEKEILRTLLENCDYFHSITSNLIMKKLNCSKSKISKILTKLEDYGIISSTYNNKGRGIGKIRYVKFSDEEVFGVVEKMFYVQ